VVSDDRGYDALLSRVAQRGARCVAVSAQRRDPGPVEHVHWAEVLRIAEALQEDDDDDDDDYDDDDDDDDEDEYAFDPSMIIM